MVVAYIGIVIIACIVLGLVYLVGVLVIAFAKQLTKQLTKPKTVKAVKGPFDHLPKMLLELADDVDTPIENVVMLAEDYVVDPPNQAPPRSWAEVNERAEQESQPRWITVPEGAPLPYTPGGAVPCVYCTELTYQIIDNKSVCDRCNYLFKVQERAQHHEEFLDASHYWRTMSESELWERNN